MCNANLIASAERSVIVRALVAAALIAACAILLYVSAAHANDRGCTFTNSGRVLCGTAPSYGYRPIIRYMRRYIGRNPTGWRHNWCGKFLSVALRRTGHAKGTPRAIAYRRYGRPAAGPAPGVIGVMPHHVFIVTAVLSARKVRAISGNDGHRVRERVRSTAGVIAWRWP